MKQQIYPLFPLFSLILSLAACQSTATPAAKTAALPITPSLIPVQTLTPSTSPTASTTLTALVSPTLEDIQGTEPYDSPDGRLTAIFRPQNRNLEIVDAQGKTVLVFSPDSSTPDPSSTFGEWITLGSWSPDSQRLLFWKGMNSASIQADGLPLWVLDIQSGQAKEVSQVTLVNKAYQSWSPDSKALAFTNGGSRSAQVDKWLSLYQVENEQVKDLITKEELVTGAVAWSPAGDQIAVAAVEASKTGSDYADYMGWDNPAIAGRRIYLVDPETGEYQRLTQTETYEDAPKWSRDGTRLFFVQQGNTQADVMSVNVETGELMAIAGCETPMPSSAIYYGQVDWSDLYANCEEDTPTPPTISVSAFPTPGEPISSNAIQDGPFTFDIRFYRDVIFGKNPVASSLYSDLEGIGVYFVWEYHGPDLPPPVTVYWGIDPDVSALLSQSDYARNGIKDGDQNGREGGLTLPMGSKAGDQLKAVLKIETQDKIYGAAINFVLKEGEHGLEPDNVTIQSLGMN
ncbi:MAG: hypothetical protein LLG42_14460 [Chloroflexi bacterium]|nr:hypothetical protein [Chloroflexota bacterium]